MAKWLFVMIGTEERDIIFGASSQFELWIKSWWLRDSETSFSSSVEAGGRGTQWGIICLSGGCPSRGASGNGRMDNTHGRDIHSVRCPHPVHSVVESCIKSIYRYTIHVSESVKALTLTSSIGWCSPVGHPWACRARICSAASRAMYDWLSAGWVCCTWRETNALKLRSSCCSCYFHAFPESCMQGIDRVIISTS